jgi:hypothetical protein
MDVFSALNTSTTGKKYILCIIQNKLDQSNKAITFLQALPTLQGCCCCEQIVWSRGKFRAPNLEHPLSFLL